MKDLQKDRRGFLGIAAKTMVAAAGVTLLPQGMGAANAAGPRQQAAAARAQRVRGNPSPDATVTYSCCLNTVKCPTSQCGSQYRYYCTSNNSCAPPYCTSCGAGRGSCYSFQSGC